MAEIVDQSGQMHDVASNGKANAGLTLGIIGTALGAIGGGVAGLMGSKFGTGSTASTNNATVMTSEDLYIERKQAADNLAQTEAGYQWRIDNLKNLTNAFFDAYKRDNDNYWDLATKDHDNYDILNQKIIDASFGLYKNGRDEKDALVEKINAVDKKVDMMAAVRPYQDALINCKIDNTALMADYNLYRRTCRMIQGTLVLPSSDEITGYPSNYYYSSTSGTTA